MADRVGANRQLLRRMAIAMAISIPISVTSTVVAMIYVFGSDPDATISVSLAFKFGLVMAVIGPALVGPLASYRTHMAIRDRDRAQIELRRVAETDQLTGLLNRRGFETAATGALAAGEPRPSISVLMLDVDFFKSINDRFGHDFGDAALVHVAGVLRDTGRPGGIIVGRQGGEEFIALLLDADEAETVDLAARWVHTIAVTPIAFGNKTASITVSIGAASGCLKTSSLSQLVSEADSALYSAKARGRNCVVPHRLDLAFDSASRAPLAPDLPAVVQ